MQKCRGVELSSCRGSEVLIWRRRGAEVQRFRGAGAGAIACTGAVVLEVQVQSLRDTEMQRCSAAKVLIRCSR